MHERPILMSGPLVCATLENRKTQTRRLFKVRGPDGKSRPITSPHESVELGIDDRGATYLSTGGMSGPYPCPYGVPGDRLWVRETWRPTPFHLCGAEGCDCDDVKITYPADNASRICTMAEGWTPPGGWRRYDGTAPCAPSIHMPRWASRLTLEVTGVRVERLQDITEEDARAEGVVPDEAEHCRGGFGGGQHTSRVSRTEVLSCPLCAGTGYQRNAYKNAFRALWNQLNGDCATWESNPWVWVITFKVEKSS